MRRAVAATLPGGPAPARKAPGRRTASATGYAKRPRAYRRCRRRRRAVRPGGDDRQARLPCRGQGLAALRCTRKQRGHAGSLPARGRQGNPAAPQSHRAARRLRHRQAHQATLWHPAAPHLPSARCGVGRRRGRDRPARTSPSALAGRPSSRAWRRPGRDRPRPGAVPARDTRRPARPRPPGRHDRRLPGTPGAYWVHGPDHRDNPRRDPRHLACLHGRRRDLCHAQDVCHHRADRHGRLHRRVARGQAPSPRLAWAQPRHPGAITGPRMSLATTDTRPAVMADSGSSSGPAWPWRRSPRHPPDPPATSRATARRALNSSIVSRRHPAPRPADLEDAPYRIGIVVTWLTGLGRPGRNTRFCAAWIADMKALRSGPRGRLLGNLSWPQAGRSRRPGFRSGDHAAGLARRRRGSRASQSESGAASGPAPNRGPFRNTSHAGSCSSRM